MVILVLNIVVAIGVIVYDLKTVRQVENDYPDDWFSKEINEGYWAKYWFIACVVVSIVNMVVSGVALFVAYKDHSQLSMICGVLLMIIAVYAAYDKYMRNCFVSFIVPMVAGMMCILFASLNHIMFTQNTSVLSPDVQYVKKANVSHSPPPTPQVINQDDSDEDETHRLKSPA